MKGEIKILLVDAANTIIHKPDLWAKYLGVLHRYGYRVDMRGLKEKHRLISEVILFPDRTSESFYQTFNSEILFSLGIVPTEEILTDLFDACTYLPWKTFEDFGVLKTLNVRKAVLSNFKSSLKEQLRELCGGVFETIIASEEIGLRKPDVDFYQRAIELLGVNAEQILYVGDSLKLDIHPAQAIGMNAWLIDRDRIYSNFEQRLDSLEDLSRLIG